MISLEDNIQTFFNSLTSNLNFIDTNLSNYQSLIPDTNNSNVVLIDSQQDGIEQITQPLEQYDNLDTYQADLAAWGNALSTGGDLLLYGGNVDDTLAGLNVVDRVGEITGTDVTVSNDLTGNANLDGDWTLEIATGNIETPTLAITEDGDVLGLNFNFTYDYGVTTAQKTAFEFAGKAWSNVLADDVTVNIHVSMVNNSDLPCNTLGGATPFFHKATSYEQTRNKLSDDSSSNDDYTAVQNLESGSTFEIQRPYDDNLGWREQISQVAMTRANAKALGLVDSHDSTLDGTIVMNDLKGTGVDWQYNYLSNGIAGNQIDFTTVAIHEVGHTLGFVSLVDGLTNSNYTDSKTINTNTTTLDLYRYMDNHVNMRNIRSTGSVFSIDRGYTQLAHFSTSSRNLGGDNYSDGYQASHWNNRDNSGIMDPLLELGIRREITDLDLRAMDVIGWDRQAGSSSTSNLWSQAQNEAGATGNINLNLEVGEMLNDWRWARRGSKTRLTQQGNIGQFLAEEGFFSVGAFRESFDFSSVNSVVKNDSIIVVDHHSLAQGVQTNNDLDLANSSEIISDIDIQDVVVESSGINYEETPTLVTEELLYTELGQLSLDDLAQLIKQRLAELIVSALS